MEADRAALHFALQREQVGAKFTLCSGRNLYSIIALKAQLFLVWCFCYDHILPPFAASSWVVSVTFFSSPASMF